jgi:anti-sigma regulatory factor (Ser/Thr protein kinase)/CheY-like chemotaxis protein
MDALTDLCYGLSVEIRSELIRSMKRILTIGETNPSAQWLASSLSPESYEVVRCAGGADAIRLLRARAFDVLVTDPTTPAREDLAIANEGQRTRPGLRIVVLSSATTPDDIITALKTDVFACFSAPFEPVDVAAMIKSAADATPWQNGIEVVSALPHWITLRVSCRLITAERLVRFMTEYRTDVADDDRFRLMTAFREMLLNAMEHGAGFDPEKVVEVTAAKTAEAIVYHFRDPGHGFDRATLGHAARSAAPDDLLASVERREDLGLRAGGFGILLVRAIVDEVLYNESGNEVLLIKRTAERTSKGG